MLLEIAQLLLNIERFFIANMVCNNLVDLVLYLVSRLLKVTHMVIYLAVLLYLNPEKALLEKVGRILRRTVVLRHHFYSDIGYTV